MKVHLSEDFLTGNTYNDKFVDVPFMSEVQRELLFAFIRDVTSDKALLGKNKPSWLDDNLDVIPNTESYREFDFWHYHCGEFDPNAKIRQLTYQLKLNLFGLTSSAVIHYRKIEDGEIIVVGFSPIHIPFPVETDPDNPLFSE